MSRPYESRPTIRTTARLTTTHGWYEQGVRVHLNMDGSVEIGRFLGRFFPVYPTDTLEDGWRLFKCPGGGDCVGHEDVCERHHKAMLPEKDWQRLAERAKT